MRIIAISCTVVSLMQLDSFDLAILRLLGRDARMPVTAMASRVALSPSAVSRRIAALEKAGVIRAYQAVFDEAALGYHLVAFVEVRLERQGQEEMEAFERAMRQLPFVADCHLMSGEADYLIRVYARDMAHFERIHRQDLSRLPHVARLTTSFAMRSVDMPSAWAFAGLGGKAG